MSAWREALDARDEVAAAHGDALKSAATHWLDGIVGGRLGVQVIIDDGRVITGTPSEIGDLVAVAVVRHPYKVVVGSLARRIRRGEFGASGQLPTRRELMAHYGVTMAVADHARRELIAQGVAYSAGPHGTFAVSQAPAGQDGEGAAPAQRPAPRPAPGPPRRSAAR